MRSIKAVLAAFYNGGCFSDEEAVALRDHTKQAADTLVVMGDTFKIAFKEANTVNLRLNDICQARGIG